jgi:hypothetical protein
MKRLPIFLLLSALAVSAVACGGDDDDDDTAAAAATDTTELTEVTEMTDDVPDLSEAEMQCPLDTFSLEAITGYVFLEPDPVIQTGDGVSCTFSSESGDLGVSVTTYATTARAAMDTVNELADDAEPVSIDFADEAVWSPSMTILHVVKGDAGAQVQLSDFTGGAIDPLQVATELAEFSV